MYIFTGGNSGSASSQELSTLAKMLKSSGKVNYSRHLIEIFNHNNEVKNDKYYNMYILYIHSIKMVEK